MSRARQARSVETRGRLLAAARAAIAEHGIEGASVDAIAERAERTSGSLYGHFGSKDGLVVALLDESKDVVARSMLADIEAASSLDDRLAALWRNFCRPPPRLATGCTSSTRCGCGPPGRATGGSGPGWASATAPSSPRWPRRWTRGPPRA
jgi:AcrR family transcriptional regulator